MGKRELKIITIQNKPYNYIECETSNNNTYYDTTFIQVPIDDNYKDMFEGVGGFSRDVLYNSIKDLDVDQLTILSIPTKQYSMLTQFIFEKDGLEVHHVTTVEDLFLGHVVDFLTDNVHIVGEINVQNSLYYLHDDKYMKYFEHYHQPTSSQQSGLYYGEEPILFGESYSIKGLTNNQDTLQGDLLRVVKGGGVDGLYVQVNDSVGGFNIVTQEILIKKDGTIFTYLDDDLLLSDKYTTKQELVNAEVKEYFKHTRSKSEEQYRKEVEKELASPYVILLSKESMNVLLNLEGVTVTIH